MSGGFPYLGSICNPVAYGYGTISTTSGFNGTTVNPSATANTKGSWVQITASTTADITFLEVMACLINGSSGNLCFLTDIGVGASGSEVVLVPNLSTSVSSNNTTGIDIIIPLNIPAGTRISARCQCDTASMALGYLQVGVKGYDGDFVSSDGFGGVDALTSSTSTSHGANITLQTAAFSSWTQLVATTSRDYTGFFYYGDSSGTTYFQGQVDIGVGASGSEVSITGGDFVSANLAFNDGSSRVAQYRPIQIPAGSRISARAWEGAPYSNTAAIHLYGVYR